MIAKARSALALAIALLLVSVAGATAQSMFSAVAKVGDRIVTGYELQQRMLLLELQGLGGDLREEAMTALINERLQLQAAEDAGVTVSAEELAAAVENIAARTDRNADQFLADLSAEGIAPETFLDSTRAGLAWRTLVQGRFGAVATVSDSELERALGLGASTGTLEFRFAEIFLPTNTQNNADITAQLAPQIAALTDFAQFEDAARRFSVAASRENGGVIARWMPISELPANLQPVLIEMRPGQVTEPIEFPGAVGLFQLRAKREARATGQGQSVDYISWSIKGDGNQTASERAREILEETDACLDLYGHANGDAALVRQTVPTSAVPQSVALEIARLDADESTFVSGPGAITATILSVCGRPARGEITEEDKANARRALANEKLGNYADAYLEELRGETVITRK